jgi:nuclear pore complex protein Nup98-Nup96
MFGQTQAPAATFGFGQQPTASAAPAAAFSFGQATSQPAAFGGFGAKPAATSGGMFGQPATGFGQPTAFGQPQPAAAASPFGFGQSAATTFGMPANPTTSGGMFGSLGGFGSSVSAAPTAAFGLPATSAPAAFGGFGAPAAAASPFGQAAPAGFGGFGQPAPQVSAPFGGGFGAPATSTPAAFGGFGAPAAAASPFGQAAPAGFGGFGQPAAAPAAFGGFGAPASAAPAAAFSFGQATSQPAAFGGFGAKPAATSGGMFGGFGAPAAFGQSQPSQASTFGFGQQPTATSAPLAAFGGFGAPAQQPQNMMMPQQQPVGFNPMEQKMELLRSKREELNMQLKDERLYGARAPDGMTAYSTTTFAVPRSLPSYQHTSRSTTKIVPRGLVSSATMTVQRPLSSVLSIAANGGATHDMMSPEKLLGRSAKKLIILSANNGLDPTIDLPLPSYQQKQQQSVRFQQDNEPSRLGITPPRALSLETNRDRPLALTSGDMTGLTPSHTRSPYTPSVASPHTPATGTSNGTPIDRPQKPTQRVSTPYVPNRGERESIDHSFTSNNTPDQDTSSLALEAPSPPILERPGYLTTPTMSVLRKMSSKELTHVKNFSVYRPNIGKIEWDGETDVRGLDLDLIVNIEKRGVEVYDSDDAALIKPAMGYGLNKSAIIYLDDIYPPEGSTLQKRNSFIDKLRKICEKSGSEFIDYSLTSGQWIFRVQHFSRYGLDDSDDEEVPATTNKVIGVRKQPIVLSPSGANVKEKAGTGAKGADECIPSAASEAIDVDSDTMNKETLQHTNYSLSLSGSDPSDLKRMRLSFSGRGGQESTDKGYTYV